MRLHLSSHPTVKIFSTDIVDMCQFASSYTSSKLNVEKIQPSHAQEHSISLCVGGSNFLYI